MSGESLDANRHDVSARARETAPRATGLAPSKAALGALFVSVTLLSSASIESAELASPTEITVVTDFDYPPSLFSTSSGGELQGITKDKWDLWSKRNGVAVRVVGMQWGDAQKALLDGRYDVIESIVYTPARAAQYEFSPPYATVEANVYFHRSISGINDVASMRGFTIGAKEGSACGKWLADHGIEHIRNYVTSESLVAAAGAGDVRLFCMDSMAAQYHLFKQGLADEFRQSPPLYSTHFHWAVRKDRTELRDFIQRGFERITPAELEAIDARWIGNPVRFPIARRYLYGAAVTIAVVLALAGILSFWSLLLRSRVAARTAELNSAVRQLRDSEARYRMVVQHQTEFIVKWLPDGTRTFVNESYCRYFGVQEAQCLGTSFFPLMVPEFRDEVRRRTAALRPDAPEYTEEHLAFAPNGERWQQWTNRGIFDADGKLVEVLSTGRDITERRLAEEKVRESEATFRALADASDEIVWTMDEDGHVLNISNTFEPLADERTESLKVSRWLEFVHPDDRATTESTLRRALKSGDRLQMEHRLRTRDGEYRYYLTRGFPIRAADGSIRMWVGMTTDIHERRLSDEMLRASEARFRTLYTGTPAMMHSIDRVGKITSVSDLWLSTLGYKAEEVIGRKSVDFLTPASRAYAENVVLPEFFRTGACRDVSYQFVKKNGEIMDVLLSAIGVRDADGNVLRSLAVLVDVTAQKAAEQALRRHSVRLQILSRRLLEAQEQERQQIARELHDQIGQSLTAVQINLQTKPRGDTAHARKRLADSAAIVEQVLRQVRDLSLDLRPPMLDDLGLVAALRWHVAKQAERTGIDATFELEAVDDWLDAAGKIACFRIVQEALTNVVRHARARRVSIKLWREDKSVHASIRDDGAGFDVMDFRASERQHAHLGLLGMQERASLAGGRLEVHSAPGRGTEIHLELPLQQSPPAREWAEGHVA